MTPKRFLLITFSTTSLWICLLSLYLIKIKMFLLDLVIHVLRLKRLVITMTQSLLYLYRSTSFDIFYRSYLLDFLLGFQANLLRFDI